MSASKPIIERIVVSSDESAEQYSYDDLLEIEESFQIGEFNVLIVPLDEKAALIIVKCGTRETRKVYLYKGSIKGIDNLINIISGFADPFRLKTRSLRGFYDWFNENLEYDLQDLLPNQKYSRPEIITEQ